MNLLHYYWYFNGALSTRFCDDLVKYGNQQTELIGQTGVVADALKKNKDVNSEEYKKEYEKLSKQSLKKRNSKVAFIDEQWIYKEIHPLIHIANKNAGWNFQWERSEPCQFTKYSPGQYYDWHCDSWDSPYNKPDTVSHGKIRKLSMTCSLSHPEDYKGGRLEFQFRNKDNPNETIECTEIMTRGSVVIFPSFLWHRVRPVTEGTRYSLVVWNMGNPFT